MRREKARIQEDERRNNSHFENIKNRHALGNPIQSGYFANQVKYQNAAGSSQEGDRNNLHNIYAGIQGDHFGKHATSEVALRPCPKCNKSFPDIETLQIHLMDCIDD